MIAKSSASRSVALHGIDGCPGGWLVLTLRPEDDTPSACIYASLKEFGKSLGEKDIVAIDMPIGLPEKTPRQCDICARDVLQHRRNAVFDTPCRDTLLFALDRDAGPSDWLEQHERASHWHHEQTGRGLSVQSYCLLPKLKELDEWLASLPNPGRICEVHPELSFAHMKGKGVNPAPTVHTKHTRQGRHERLRLLPTHWQATAQSLEANRMQPGGLKAFTFTEPVRGKRRRRWQIDDLLDAFACLWTALRIAEKAHMSFPQEMHPSRDAKGLPMQIHA